MGRQPSPRILIVEDNTLIAMDLEDILEGFGCQVVGPVGTVREALALLKELQVDVAVVDFQLEDGNSGPSRTHLTLMAYLSRCPRALAKAK